MKSHPNVNEWMNEWIAIEQTSGDRIANINCTRIAPDLETRFSKLITLSAFGLWIIIIIIITKKHVDCLWYRYLWASSRNIMFIYFSISFSIGLFCTRWKKQQIIRLQQRQQAVHNAHTLTLSILFRSTLNSVLKWRWMIYRNNIIHSQSGFLCLTFCV